MAYLLSLMNEKGGVGKTALTFSVGWYLMETGKRVLFVDMDGQNANLSYLSGIETNKQTKTLQDVLLHDCPIQEAILEYRKHESRGLLDILPATVAMAELPQTARISALRKAVGQVRRFYDYILFDMNPSPDWRHALVLSVVDGICPVILPDIVSLAASAGLFESIQEIQGSTNGRLQVVGFLVNQYDGRPNLSKAVLEKVRELGLYHETRVLGSMVRRSVKMAEAAAMHVGITEYAPRSPIAEDVRALCGELVKLTMEEG